MLVTRGKIIKVSAGCDLRWQLERNCETPGRVTVRNKDGQLFHLPGNKVDAKTFIEAYQKVLNEDIAYKESEIE